MGQRFQPRGSGWAVALAAYLSISVLFFGLPVLAHLSTRIVGRPGDPAIFMWDLGWWLHALGHGLNPLYTKLVWAPEGLNLAWITGLPGPSAVAAPVTAIFGPIASYNVLALLAPALSAWTAFLLFRHVTRSFWPSLAGGYFFGFSTYEIGHTLGHLNLTLVFLVPLAVLLVLLRMEDRLTTKSFVLLLALVLTFQFLISTEVLLTMTGFGVVAMLLAALFVPHARAALKGMVLPIAGAFALAGVVLSPFAYHMLRQGIPNAPLNPPFFFSADVLNLFIPTRITLIGGSAFQSISDRFTGGDAGRTAYLGLPLISIAVLFAVSQWRCPVGKVLTILLGVLLIASFGNRLHLAGITRIRLPWVLFAHLPVVENALPVRFTMFAFLVAGAMVALWLVRGTGSPVFRWAVVVLAAIFLLPNVFLRGWHSEVTIPSFFKQPLQARSLSASGNVLVLPLKSGDPLIWQSVSDFSFRMAGGSTGPSPPHYIRSPALLRLWNGQLPSTRREFLELLRARNVGVVVVRDPSPLQGPVTKLLRVVPQRIGGLLLFRVPGAATPRRISR